MAAAILDVDGTLVSGTLGLRLLSLLSARSDTCGRCLEEITELAAQRNAGTLSHRAFAIRSTHLFGAAIEGVGSEVLDDLSRQVLADPNRVIHPFTADLIALLKDRSLTPMLISSSPDFMVRCLADMLGVAHSAGTRYLKRAGSYTKVPSLIPQIDGGKTQLAVQTAAPATIDWRRSLALGNGMADEPVLSAVGTPVVFEPDPDLELVAQRKGWPAADRATILGQIAILLAPTTKNRAAT